MSMHTVAWAAELQAFPPMLRDGEELVSLKVSCTYVGVNRAATQLTRPLLLRPPTAAAAWCTFQTI